MIGRDKEVEEAEEAEAAEEEAEAEAEAEAESRNAVHVFRSFKAIAMIITKLALSRHASTSYVCMKILEKLLGISFVALYLVDLSIFVRLGPN